MVNTKSYNVGETIHLTDSTVLEVLQDLSLADVPYVMDKIPCDHPIVQVLIRDGRVIKYETTC